MRVNDIEREAEGADGRGVSEGEANVGRSAHYIKDNGGKASRKSAAVVSCRITEVSSGESN